MEGFKCNMKFNVIVHVVLFLKTEWDVITNVKRLIMFMLEYFTFILRLLLCLFIYRV